MSSSKARGGAISLNGHVKDALGKYFNDLDGHSPGNLYQLLIGEVERPLLEAVMEYCGGNQTKAATVLGINRGTLRKKLQQYDLNQ